MTKKLIFLYATTYLFLIYSQILTNASVKFVCICIPTFSSNLIVDRRFDSRTSFSTFKIHNIGRGRIFYFSIFVARSRKKQIFKHDRKFRFCEIFMRGLCLVNCTHDSNDEQSKLCYIVIRHLFLINTIFQ